ncbi:hypothetical protein BU14_0407s0023 [Porphyra umbilicalis]|uniref:Pseudouridine synthase RsuA/RluA-like domain-containing protein n=1 Tax=Porphyra umbilicalis TaxID=2786 RepID=A0A1X6NVV8_PORUM|nr:hypothetical protein BU14_0407s0023 [Porphyra umbilicalis]|eukprot:OSX72759.1 hypothetical protein BU14_0407s0023 [Porphyra umbilicalis]
MHRNADLDASATTFVQSQVEALVAPAPVFIVSRLDRATSGAVALAVGSAATAAALQAALAAPSTVKEYVALVVGPTPAAEWVNDHPLRDMVGGRSSGSRRRRRGGGGGGGGGGGTGSATKGGTPRAASTAFTTLAYLPDADVSLVAARLATGRRHQVRRHLANARMPIAGDTTHGKGAVNRALRDAYGLPRMFLHARALAFDHPTEGGVRVAAAVPLAADLVACLERLPGWEPWMLAAVNGEGGG